MVSDLHSPCAGHLYHFLDFSNNTVRRNQLYRLDRNDKTVGLKNYANLFQDSILKIAVKNNLIYGIILLAAVPVLAFFIAYLIETFIRRKMFWRTVAYLPAILPVIVTVLLWKWIYNPQ